MKIYYCVRLSKFIILLYRTSNTTGYPLPKQFYFAGFVPVYFLYERFKSSLQSVVLCLMYWALLFLLLRHTQRVLWECRVQILLLLSSKHFAGCLAVKVPCWRIDIIWLSVVLGFNSSGFASKLERYTSNITCIIGDKLVIMLLQNEIT
jgi:hypothetical protein